MTEFILKRESLNTITDIEMAFGTTKLLPPLSAVPEDFKRGNDYTKLLDSLFAGQPVPDGEIVFREGFDDADAPALMHRVVMARLRSFEPKHEHKIAGLGYWMETINGERKQRRISRVIGKRTREELWAEVEEIVRRKVSDEAQRRQRLEQPFPS